MWLLSISDLLMVWKVAESLRVPEALSVSCRNLEFILVLEAST